MSKHHFWQLSLLCIFVFSNANAVTLTSGQTDYTTPSDITTSGIGISSSLVGTSVTSNKIKNTFTITTGNSGATSSAYGIRTTGNYNQITNALGAAIQTTGSSGRGISVANLSSVINEGSISTLGSSAYGIYAGGNTNSLSNSGSITTINSSAYGIYLDGDNNSATNSGSINTRVYGIYGNGNVNQIISSGTITTTVGSSAHGIYVSAGTSSTASASSYSTINNSGTIQANANGIYAKDNYTRITNSGAITSGSGDYGIRTEGENSVISNSGNIISDEIAIYNSGAGTVITNSGVLSGGVRIGGGTLNISGGSISGEVDGVDGAGNINIIADFTQSANFSEIGTLNIASGTTLNSAAAIDASAITINSGGVLNMNSGSSLSGVISGDGALRINSGAVFAASGVIDIADIFLGGTFSSSGSTITGDLAGSGSGVFDIAAYDQIINGDFTLNDGDELAVTLKNNGVGNLATSGMANISMNSRLAISTAENQGYIADGTSYTLVSSGSGSSISEISTENISVNGNDSNIYGMLRFSTSTASDGLTLNINRLSASEVTSDSNMQNIYEALNEIGAGSSGKLLQFQEYLYSSGNAEALSQLAPQSTKATLGVTNDIVLNSIKTVEKRIKKNRRDDAWVEYFSGSAAQDEVVDDVGYKSHHAGIALGFDRAVSDSSLFGASLSLAQGRVKSLDGSKKNYINSYQANIYSSQNFGAYFLDIIGGFAWNHYVGSRAITALDVNATSSYSGQTYALKIKNGFEKKLRRGFNLTPEASLNFLHNEISQYEEQGADELNLRVDGVSANFLEARLGMKLGYETAFSAPEFNRISAAAKISYGYAIINDAPTTRASFVSQDDVSFDSQITNQDRSSLKFELDLTAFHKDDVDLSADYELEKRASYISHSVFLRLREEF